MEFKYRATDEKGTKCTHQSSNYSCFPEQAFRGGYTGFGYNGSCSCVTNMEDYSGLRYMGPGYSGLSTGPEYLGPSTGPGYSGPSTGPEYPGPSTGPGYSGPSTGPGYPGLNMGHPHECCQEPLKVHKAIWRELEKEKIKQEIIAEEIVRRRMLEAEVRRELMIERELTMHRGGDGSLFMQSPSAMRFEPRGLPALPPLFHRAEEKSLEERIGKSLEERIGKSLEERIGKLLEERIGKSLKERLEISTMLRHGEIDGLQTTPSQPQRSVELRISEVKPVSEISKEKEKFIFLAKPREDLSEVKRKAETPPAMGTAELSLARITKKNVKEWSCSICQVIVADHDLNEHLQGRRHKAKEAGLKKNGKNSRIGLFPKNAVKPNKIADIAGNPTLEKGIDSVGGPPQSEKLEQPSLLTESNSDSPKENDDPLWTNNVAIVQKKQKRRELKREDFKFWCEMCKAGAGSEKVMEQHRTGNKHIKQLHKLIKMAELHF